MTLWILAQATPPLPEGPGLLRSVGALVVVLGLFGLCLWALRRGGFSLPGRQGSRVMQVESALPLGDRRQLVIVRVEGRRLLLGLSAMQISLVAELGAEEAFSATLDARLTDGEDH